MWMTLALSLVSWDSLTFDPALTCRTTGQCGTSRRRFAHVSPLPTRLPPPPPLQPPHPHLHRPRIPSIRSPPRPKAYRLRLPPIPRIARRFEELGQTTRNCQAMPKVHCGILHGNEAEAVGGSMADGDVGSTRVVGSIFIRRSGRVRFDGFDEGVADGRGDLGLFTRIRHVSSFAYNTFYRQLVPPRVTSGKTIL